MSEKSENSYYNPEFHYKVTQRNRKGKKAELRRRGIETRTCFYCHTPRHIISACPIRERDESAQLIKDAIDTGINYYPQERLHSEEEYILKGFGFGTWRDVWYVSPKVQNHISGNLDYFLKLKKSFGVESRIKNDFVFIRGVGIINIEAEENSLIIPNVFYSNDLEDNILSLPQLRLQGFIVKIDENTCSVQNMLKNESMQFKLIKDNKDDKESMLRELGDDHEHNQRKNEYLNEYFEELSLNSEQNIKQMEESVHDLEIDSIEKCIEFLDIIDHLKYPWAHRDLLKDHFLRMVDWFLNFYLKVPNRPIPPVIEQGKKVNLFDLYILVKREGGHERVSKYNIWVVIAKELGMNYEDKDILRILYAKYLDVLEWQYQVYKAALNIANKEEKNGVGCSEVRETGLVAQLMNLLHQNSTKMHEDYALYMGGDWESANQSIKKCKFDFSQVEKALKEAMDTLPRIFPKFYCPCTQKFYPKTYF